MEATTLVRDIASLPPEAQKQVSEFVAFLKTRHPVQPRARKAKRTKLADEPFVGMWRDRKGMRDGGAWASPNLQESERLPLHRAASAPSVS